MRLEKTSTLIKLISHLKSNTFWGMPQEVQWLGLCASTAGAWVQTMVRKLRPHILHDGAKINK